MRRRPLETSVVRWGGGAAAVRAGPPGAGRRGPRRAAARHRARGRRLGRRRDPRLPALGYGSRRGRRPTARVAVVEETHARPRNRGFPQIFGNSRAGETLAAWPRARSPPANSMTSCCTAATPSSAPPRPLPQDRTELAAEADALLEQSLAKDVYTRGTYDISGYRADADLMIWWTCPDPDVLQETYGRFRSTALGGSSSRSGRRTGCTARPSSTATTSRPTSGARTRGTTSASTRSCARWSGTCCRTTSARACSPSTGSWDASTPTCAPIPSPPSVSAITSGCSRSRPTSCTASSTASGTCAPAAPGCTPSSRSPSTPGVRKPLARDRRRARLAGLAVGQAGVPALLADGSPMSSSRRAPSGSHPAAARNVCIGASPSKVHSAGDGEAGRRRASGPRRPASRLPWPIRCSAGTTVKREDLAAVRAGVLVLAGPDREIAHDPSPR